MHANHKYTYIQVAALIAALTSVELAAKSPNACEQHRHKGDYTYVSATFRTLGPGIYPEHLSRDAGTYPDLLSANGTTVVGRVMIDPNLYPEGNTGFRHNRWYGLLDLDTLGGNFSIPTGVSAGGAVVAGYSELEDGTVQAFRWTRHYGIRALGTLGGDSSEARAISGDNACIVGVSVDASARQQAFRWIYGQMRGLGFLKGGSMSEALAVSGNGNVVVGTADVAGAESLHAFRWSRRDGMQDLGLGSTGGDTTANHVSLDGKVVVGADSKVIDPETYRVLQRTWRWTARRGMQDIGSLGGDSIWPAAISADGDVIAGTGTVPNAFGWEDYHPFRWTEAGGLEDLVNVDTPLAASYCFVTGVSADGTIVTGAYVSPENWMLHPFIWDPENKLQDLRQLLLDLGVDLADWGLGLGSAIDVVRNGRNIIIAGGGFHPDYKHEAWCAKLSLGRRK